MLRNTIERYSFRSGRFDFSARVEYLPSPPLSFDLTASFTLFGILSRAYRRGDEITRPFTVKDVGIEFTLTVHVFKTINWKWTDLDEALAVLAGHFLEETREVKSFIAALSFVNAPQRENDLTLNFDILSPPRETIDIDFGRGAYLKGIILQGAERLMTSDVRNIIALWKQKYHRFYHAPLIARAFDPINARGDDCDLVFGVERLPDPRIRTLYYRDIEQILDYLFTYVETHYQSVWWPTYCALRQEGTGSYEYNMIYIIFEHHNHPTVAELENASDTPWNTTFSNLGNQTIGTS